MDTAATEAAAATAEEDVENEDRAEFVAEDGRAEND